MRSAEFDKEKVLRAAIKAFVCKGYNKTSMQDLKKATGLHPGSIYCAFENKQGLLLAALEQYNKDRAEEFRHYFIENKRVLTGVKKYLDNTVNQCTLNGSEKTCLSQKALSELSEQAPEVEALITNNIESWQKSFEQVFEQAQVEGEVDSSRSPNQRAQSLVMGIYGLRTYAHTQPSEDILKALAQQLFEDVCR